MKHVSNICLIGTFLLMKLN